MKNRANLLIIGVAMVFAAAVTLFWFHLSSALPTAKNDYRLTAVLNDVTGLAGGANVTIAGIRVGRVESVERRDGKGVIELSVRDEDAPLPEDTRYGVRLRTVVGENYLELYPGTSDVDLPKGGLLAEGAANEYVDIDQILDTLGGPTRERAQLLFQSLGDTVGDRGKQLNGVLKGAAGLIDNAQRPLDALDDHREQVSRLVDDLGVVTVAIGDRGTVLRELVDYGVETAEAMAAQDDALRGALDRLPATMRQVRTTTSLLDGVSGRAAPVLANLGYALRDLRPAIGALGPAANEGRKVMRELDAVAPRLETTLDRLVDLEPRTATALPALRTMMCELNPTVEHLRPYAQDIAAFTQNFGASGGYYDANAHAARLNVVVGPSSQGFSNPAVRDALDVLLDNDVVGEAFNLKYHANPGPGQGALTAQDGMASGRSEVNAKYPRVRAEC